MVEKALGSELTGLLPLSWQHLVKQTVQAHTQNFSALLSDPQAAGGGGLSTKGAAPDMLSNRWITLTFASLWRENIIAF